MKCAPFSITGILLAAICFLFSPAYAEPPRHVPPPDSALFTNAPTDVANTVGVIPLGNLNPGGGHVLAVDHMYITYPFPDTGGAYSYPVYAMADGEIVMLLRQQVPGRPDYDYQVFIRHNQAVTSYFDHLHGLSSRIMAHIAAAPDSSWISPDGTNFRLLFLGQLGAPDPLPVHAGEQVGITKSYSFSWDVGVVDQRVRGHFAGHGPRRYPDFRDFLKLLGYRIDPPFAGNKTINAVCFIDYMEPSLKTAWFELLLSDPKTCGRDAWDIDGRLRGAWFNPAVDAAAEPPLSDLEYSALSIIPDNLAPTTRVQIGAGSGNPYAALDPAGAYPQLRQPFIIEIDTATGARINPDPAAVRPTTGTVCYDLLYNDGGMARYNTMLFHMLDARRLAIKYDPAPHDSPQCGLIAPSEPDSAWVIYKR